MVMVVMDNKPTSAGKPRLWTANFIFVCLSNLTIYMVFHGTGPILPIYIERFGGATSSAGFAMAALTLAAVFSRPVSGWALDKYGRKPVLLCGILVFLLPSIVYVFMVPVAILIFFRFIQGLGWGIANTSLWTSAADIIPPERSGEGMGFYSVSLSISMAIAPALFLWVITKYTFEIFFQLCVLFIVVSFVFALLVKYPQIEKQASQTKIALLEKTALRISMFMLFISIAISTQMSFIAVYAIEQGLASAGAYFTSLALSTIVARPLSGVIIDRKGRSGYNLVILTGCISMGIAFGVLGNLSVPAHLIIGGVFFGLGFGFVQPTALSECINQAPTARRGAATATFWTAVDIGVAGGSVGWGFVANALGYGAMFQLAIVPIAVAMGIYFLRGKKGGAGSELAAGGDG